MREKVLLGSGGLVLAATASGILTALLVHDPVFLGRMTAVSAILGVGSIGLFMVGLVFPKE